jgi:hypothetical protein
MNGLLLIAGGTAGRTLGRKRHRADILDASNVAGSQQAVGRMRWLRRGATRRPRRALGPSLQGCSLGELVVWGGRHDELFVPDGGLGEL